ncbi:DUF2975 domain-containing protein [Georgenia sp. EYE_87]|uniref:DUF2975 domain-containing protein n=1 Tax=Georgenia sp. EYE_87 TaxID=2853448 RepID=UPI0020051C84|nr:DUF2975 domain-containing protein [Georgenia sp. EYE_87]MCK6209155.1 DUF2975 domain-containing protein [Georgenia sp. EYE_87]
MGNLALHALRVVLAICLAGTLFVQVVMVPLLAVDLQDDEGVVLGGLRLPVLAVVFLCLVLLGLVTIQVTLACVWRLLTMVRRGTVFSHAAFRYVDVVIGAIAVASVLMFGVAVVLAPGELAPGIVLLICGAALMIAGVALIVYVMRMLLAQAVARDTEANNLRAELDEVI